MSNQILSYYKLGIAVDDINFMKLYQLLDFREIMIEIQMNQHEMWQTM